MAPPITKIGRSPAERERACRNNKKYYAANKERERARSRARHLRDREAMATRPRPPSCELCGKPPGKYSLHCDHDHKTGLFRGWLCTSCNTSLGHFGDDVRGLHMAAAYLQRNTAGKLPTEAAARKAIPIASGFMDYFPAAIIEVAKVSYAGNQQHNAGQPLHWSRGKSTDQVDTLLRHLQERGEIDVDGHRHSAKMAWRAMAILQLELEAAGAPMARGAWADGDQKR